MFSRVSSILYLAALAIATTTVSTGPVPTGTEPASKCDVGHLQCCNSVQKGSSSSVQGLLGLLGIVLSNVDVPVGVTCSPISVIGISGTSCTAQPVCCENNDFNGVVAIGCTPVNLSL